jgi:ATP-dependent Clp protease ATP-binding subunit ClpC
VGVDVAQVRDALVASLGRAEPGRRRLPFTRAAKRALEQAVAEAAQLGSRFVGSEHLLLGLITADGSGARELLETLGADTVALRERTLALLTA